MPVFRTDFADRLRPLQPALRRKLGRADVLAEMTRAVNSSLDPERVADTLVQRVSEWLPAPCWLVLAVDDAGRVRALAARALSSTLTDPAQAVGEWVLQKGEIFAAANLADDRRMSQDAARARAAVIGFPLECRGQTVGALVALDQCARNTAAEVHRRNLVSSARGARAWGNRSRQRPAGAARRGAVGHR